MCKPDPIHLIYLFQLEAYATMYSSETIDETQFSLEHADCFIFYE